MIPRVPNAYAPYDILVEPARVKSEIWRLCLGTALCVIVMIGLTQAMVELARRALPSEVFAALAEGLDRAQTPAGVYFLLFLLVPLGIGAIVAAEVVHRRSAWTLVGPVPLAKQQFGQVLWMLALLYGAVAMLPPWSFTQNTDPGLAFGIWLRLLPFTILAIFVQVTCEELAFRGYLQTQVAARFKHPVVWMVVPSAVFALGHHLPELYGPNAWLITGWAFVFGLAAADLTARSGTLGPAIALHFANNFGALAVTSMNSDMSGLSLFHLPFGPTDSAILRAWLPIDLAMTGLSWIAARIALRR